MSEELHTLPKIQEVAWRIFGIIVEFVDGFDHLPKDAVSIVKRFYKKAERGSTF